MRIHTLLGALGIGAVLVAFALVARERAAVASPPQQVTAAAPRADIGHLILHVEGNVQRLQISWITPKKSEYNRVRTSSPFAAVLLDANGQALGSYPVDLSRFDRNPQNIGKPLRVEGCEVWDSRISTIVNVPYLPKAVAVEFRRGGKVLGGLSKHDYHAMIAKGGEPR